MKTPLLDRRWPWLVAATALLLVFVSSFFEIRFGADADADVRPVASADEIARLRERTDTNVLFILIDMLRADRLGAYGYPRDTSPTLDRLAASGVRFARHLSQSSWTKASMASLWTSLYPTRTGITRFDDVIPPGARMPAEILKEAGFVTAGIWRNGWVAPTFGFSQGFEVYARPFPRPLPPEVRIKNPTITETGTDEDVVADAIEFLRIHGDQRWFLYLHLMDLHEYLYDEQSALFGGEYSDIYDNSIRWTDGVIAVLLAHLADRGLAANTLVVVASDHGEAFRERGLEGHARRVYRETTEVPLLVSFPFKLEPGVVVEARTQNVDVWPTLLDLIGLPVPDGIDGRSLVPDLVASARGEASADGDRPGLAYLDTTWGQRSTKSVPTLAVVEGTLRYVRVDAPRGTRLEQLFDASSDPGELHDLAGTDTANLERLRARADAYLEAEPTWGEAPKREIGELELNQLRALGYAIP
jgi:arylsulfatase A-like enzyme